MSVRLRLALSQVLLCGALIPAALATSPAAAQSQLAPDNHVMTIRLQGTWQTNEHQFIFEPRTGGIGGKASGPGLLFRKIARATNTEVARGTLVPDFDDGLLRGEVREGPASVLGSGAYTREMTAWVDDRGRLWMDNYNATPDRQSFVRVPTPADEAATATWVGRWRTNRGIMEVAAEGRNFAAYLLADDGSRRERVAFTGDVQQVSGAWDSEFDAQGAWQHKPVRWGDLGLTRSADANSFTGWYSAPKAPMGLERHEWTGQRIGQTDSSSPQPPSSTGLDATAERLRGRWFTPFGPIEIAEEVVGNRVQVSGRLTSAQGQSHQIFYVPGGPNLLQIVTGITNRPEPFVLATDGLSFEVDGAGSGVNGKWRATRSDPDQPLAQPTAEQATLLRVLEGGWQERGGDARWRFPVPTQHGAITASTWRSAEGEAAVTPVPFTPAQDGRTLAGRLPDGTRVLIERNTQGQVLLVRPTPGGTPTSVELNRTAGTAADPTPSPAPAPANNGPATPASPTPPAPSPGPGSGSSPQASVEFRPLNRVGVRVDRVVVARGYPTHQVHAFVTVKNTSAVPQYFTSGFLKAILVDGDGVSYERSQPYRASGEPAELFGSTPVIQPGGELRVRYVFVPDESSPPTSLTLSEGDRRAEFPVSGL